MRRKILFKFFACFMALIFALSCVFYTIYEPAKIKEVKADALDDQLAKQKETSETNQKALDDASAEVAKLKNQAADTQAYVDQLNSMINGIQTKINELNNKIDAVNQKITEKQNELAAAQEDAEKQYDAMKLRIKFMYEHNQESYLALILQSQSIGEMMNKVEYVSKISDYDRQMLIRYNDTVNLIAAVKQELQDDHDSLVADRTELDTQKQVNDYLVSQKNQELGILDTQVATAEKLETQLKENQIKLDAEIEATANQIAAREAEFKRILAEQAAAAAAANSGSAVSAGNTGSGYFMWPTISTRLTADFNEYDPSVRVGIHHGIDIGAVTPGVVGDPVYAAADGVVVVAGYNWSGGNWVWILHDNGLVTLYMHNTSLLVSQGQYVKKGQLISYMGSTGESTGAHLHFGIRQGISGSYIDPKPYLPKVWHW
jgi:murein DD-endopeptidase MepM/ murein hydrolase activator NlpD